MVVCLMNWFCLKLVLQDVVVNGIKMIALYDERKVCGKKDEVKCGKLKEKKIIIKKTYFEWDMAMGIVMNIHM